MTRVTVIGAGRVGRTLASGLRRADHRVRVGTRDPGALDEPRADTVAAALRGADLVINATPGEVGPALFAEHADLLRAAVIVDVSNPHGIAVAGVPSVAERIQHAVPDARVVKALNTMAAPVMIAPDSLPHPVVAFLAGDDAAAKDTVADLLGTLGWARPRLIDLGDLTASRALEAMFGVVPYLFRATGPRPLALSVVAADLP